MFYHISYSHKTNKEIRIFSRKLCISIVILIHLDLHPSFSSVPESGASVYNLGNLESTVFLL